MLTFKSLSALATIVLISPAAFPGYISLFNIEGESDLSAQYVTYNALDDMLFDTNRQGVFTPNNFSAGANIVGSGSSGDIYWSLFNIEGESDLSAQYVTYNALDDMLFDTNRQGVFTPNNFGAGVNIVGSGSSGDIYWSLFNIEGESDLSAQYVTYNALDDMLFDTNRQGVFTPNSFGAGVNIVGSGSDGETYWSLFNIEDESDLSAQYVTYNALDDMLLDTNRLGVFTPNNFGAGVNIVGSGAFILPSVVVSEPGTLGMLFVGMLGLLVTIGRSYRA